MNQLSREQIPFVHILGGLDHGGTESLALSMLKHAPAGTRHIVLSMNARRSGQEAAFMRLANIVAMPQSVKGYLGKLKWLRRNLKSIRPQRVFCYIFGVNHLLAALACFRIGARMTCASGNPPPSDRALERWKWRVLLLSSRLLRVPVYACSQYVFSELRRLRVGMPGGSRVIPNGCDLSQFVEIPNARESRRKTTRDVVNVGMIARLSSIKDHHTLLHAFALLRRRKLRFEARLILAGDGPLRSELEGLARKLDITEHVDFLGPVSNVPDLLFQLDIHVFSTTKREGFGIALLEAMAAGVPIVASDVPACREVLQNGTVGVLVPPNSSRELASSISALARDPALRMELAEKGRRTVIEMYDSARLAQAWYADLDRAHA